MWADARNKLSRYIFADFLMRLMYVLMLAVTFFLISEDFSKCLFVFFKVSFYIEIFRIF